MKFFLYSGFGNYCQCYHWGDPISTEIQKEISEKEIHAAFSDFSGSGLCSLPNEFKNQTVYECARIRRGASTDVHGIVCADSEADARKLLEDYYS